MSIGQDLLYAPCPCGSGLKFKFCCFRAVRDALPPNPTQADVTIAVRSAKQPFGMVNDVDPFEDRKAVDLMRQGIVQRDGGKYAEAVGLFRKARDLQPKLYTAWNNEAHCLWLCGRFKEAVAAQEEGLKHSSDVNAFGWANLAEMHYFLGDNKRAASAADKGAAMVPLSDDAATKVCSSLACLRRHGQLLSYARNSGFDKTPWVAFYAGVAALNLDDRETALPLLATAAAEADAMPIVRETLALASKPEREVPSPSGEWLYFGIDNYEAGPLAGRALGDLEPAHRNVVCDVVEIMLCGGRLDKDGALQFLKPYRGGRAAVLRAGLAGTTRFDTAPAKTEDDAGGDNPEACARGGNDAERGDRDMIKLDLSLVAGGRLEDPADDALFRDAIADFEAGKPGNGRWERAKRGFRDLLARHPDFFRAEFNLAVMLEREWNYEEAEAILRKIAVAHPEYAFAQAAMVRCALRLGEISRAGQIVRTYRVPKELNPVEYCAWLRAQHEYFRILGDDIRAGNTADAIARIEKAFGVGGGGSVGGEKASSVQIKRKSQK